jgi:hypothetical protein
MRAGFIVVCCAATPVFAQDKVPAPEYFVDTVMATSTAQMLAVSCPTLSVDIARASLLSEGILARLAEDGFEPDTIEARMQDPSAAVGALQEAFVAKHALVGQVTAERLCEVGRMEMAEGTGIGTLLMGVSQ